MGERPVRIANFSGYYGDRRTAFDEAMGGDDIDVLIGDYLAEFTLAALSARYRDDPSSGYVAYFLDQLRPHVAAVAERGLKVVVNAGGFNPAGLAGAVRELAAEAGVRLRVAHVEGDNVLHRLRGLRAKGHRMTNLDTGAPLSSWGYEPIAANAYLGGWGITDALSSGSDVVICGRVTDASLTSGVAAWWHGWRRTSWRELAGAVTAGHIIECGPHATGGNFSGFAQIPGMVAPGFPIAEVAGDGSSVITKHGRDGGAVTVDTVTAQLMYEIQGTRYLNPDVTVHLDTVELTQEAPDRVRMAPVTGSPPSPTTKVAVFAPIGWQIVATAYVTGLDADAKVDLLREQLRALLPAVDDLEVTRLGTVAEDADSQWDATVPVRIMATARDRETLTGQNFAGRLGGLFLSSIPGFYLDSGAGMPTSPRPRVDYWPALLPTEVLGHAVVLDNGRRMEVGPPTVCEVPGQPAHPEPSGAAASEANGPTRRLPLGTIAHARSGDKGGNSNVGVWVPDDAAWPWLRDMLSTEELKRLLPETKDLDVVRHEFPHLRAVHFVLTGLLGTGGSSNLRVDPIGKAIGEYLRARHVDIPVDLL